MNIIRKLKRLLPLFRLLWEYNGQFMPLLKHYRDMNNPTARTLYAYHSYEINSWHTTTEYDDGKITVIWRTK